MEEQHVAKDLQLFDRLSGLSGHRLVNMTLTLPSTYWHYLDGNNIKVIQTLLFSKVTLKRMSIEYQQDFEYEDERCEYIMAIIDHLEPFPHLIDVQII